MRKLIILLLFPLQIFAQFSKDEIARWEKEAKDVNVIRDNWGIPHIYGKTDADAVFGLLYAQCEDDFSRVEMNYIEKLGRTAEVKGVNALYDDLLVKLVIDSADAIKDYNAAPLWLKKLCNAFADGINYYLYKTNTKPALLNHFEPWYPMLWTDGSIGAISIGDVTEKELKDFYSGDDETLSFNYKYDHKSDEDLTGSNGFAFAPSITANGKAILYINPHVTFYFRPEVHIVSDEGLNAYGAVTWGQFFIYQGFNEHCGWMHTSSYVDAADSYVEKLSNQNGKWYYLYDGKELPAKEKNISISYKTGDGQQASKTFKTLFTGHGPIMAKRDGNYLSVRADNRIMNGLIQCWERTKAKNIADYKKTLDLLGNISNNTVYADADGNIAYWHGNRVPKRDTKYDWSKPVDGTTSATEWKGYHAIDETVHIINPPNGWLQNCNSTPFTVAGNNSPGKKNYPAYMAPDGENFRGINAVRVLSSQTNYTMDKVIAAGYDTKLAAFEVLIPALIKNYEGLDKNDSLYSYLKEAIDTLKHWDFRSSETSVATTLAITWGEKISRQFLNIEVPDYANPDIVMKVKQFAAIATANDCLPALASAIKELQTKFNTWKIAWGNINRFQRISGDIQNKFDDTKPGFPVGFASSAWGMLPSYASRTYPGTIKRYGVSGNSFICVVEFGKKIKARSLLAGGESGQEDSPHFFDQGEMYSKGIFKDVLFYKDDVLKHAVKNYHPGE